MKSQPWGRKTPPVSTHRPRMTSAPAPSAFALPRPRSHFPRPRSHFSRIAFRGPRRAIGIPQQQLSTMGYPRKSYPHCCSPPCAKRSRPRACARVYIIYRSSVGRSRECPRRCGEGRRQRRTPPRAATRTCPHTAPHFPCLRPNHCAQWRKCTRQSSPLLVRSPRESLSTAVHFAR